MQKNPDRFNENFFRSLALLPDERTRINFMAAMIGCLEEYVGEDIATSCMDTALAISQGWYAAEVPAEILQQGVQHSGPFLVKR